MLILAYLELPGLAQKDKMARRLPAIKSRVRKRGQAMLGWHALRFPILCALLIAASPVCAAELGPAEPSSRWEFSLTPYAWAINVNGDVTARGHTADVNEDFFQILEKSDSLFAWMSYFEARKGRFSIFTDLVWMDLTFPGHFQRRVTGPLGLAVLTIKGKVDLDYQQLL